MPPATLRLLASLWWWLTFIFGCETEAKVNPSFLFGWFTEAYHHWCASQPSPRRSSKVVACFQFTREIALNDESLNRSFADRKVLRITAEQLSKIFIEFNMFGCIGAISFTHLH